MSGKFLESECLSSKNDVEHTCKILENALRILKQEGALGSDKNSTLIDFKQPRELVSYDINILCVEV